MTRHLRVPVTRVLCLGQDGTRNVTRLFGLGIAIVLATSLGLPGAPRLEAAEKKLKGPRGPIKSDPDRPVIFGTVPKVKGPKGGTSDGKYIIRKLPARAK